jgi:N-terminal half of MaoC dehydratase
MSDLLSFDALVVGETLGPIETRISEKAVRGYCEDWDDANPYYLEASPLGAPVAPAAFMAGLTGFRLLGSKYDASATIGVKTEHENLAPIPVGQTMRTKGIVADKYVKRGLEYVVIASTSYDEAGNAFRRSTDHILLSLKRRAGDGG